MALKNNVTNTVGQIPGSPSLDVPYDTAAVVLSGIMAASQQLVVHRMKSRHLANKASQLVAALQDQASRSEGTELQQTADKVINALQCVYEQIDKYCRYNRVKSFLRAAEVENGLDKCLSGLDAAMSLFSVSDEDNAKIIIQNEREIQKLIRTNTTATNDLLRQILTSQEDMKRIYQMQVNGERAAERIMEAGQVKLRELREDANGQEYLAGSLSGTPPPSPKVEGSQRYLDYQCGLINLHRATGVPPAVKSLNGEVKPLGELSVTGGTYTDVRVGLWLGQEKVALKALRNISTRNKNAQKCFEREIGIWSKLKHKNILAFYGIVTDLGRMDIVSPWQEHGNVLEYVQQHPQTNRLRLLSGAAEGLEYLHKSNIVHGNLKCANILVASDRNARICDFGMSTVIEDLTKSTASATLTASGSMRWLAPELIEGSIMSPTFHTDTYSFAMAILELLTEQHPYSHRKRDASAIHDIVVLRKMPPRPLGIWLTDDLWVLMQQCWSGNADARPSMSVVTCRMMELLYTDENGKTR